MKKNEKNAWRYCPFIEPEKPKFWKNEKNPEDLIILQMCTINDNHMMYGS